jgi:hypothetical protein
MKGQGPKLDIGIYWPLNILKTFHLTGILGRLGILVYSPPYKSIKHYIRTLHESAKMAGQEIAGSSLKVCTPHQKKNSSVEKIA